MRMARRWSGAVGSQHSAVSSALRHRAPPRWRRAPSLAVSSVRQPQLGGQTSGWPGQHRRWAEARRGLRSFAFRGSAARGAKARCPFELRWSAPRSRQQPALTPPASASAAPSMAALNSTDRKFCNNPPPHGLCSVLPPASQLFVCPAHGQERAHALSFAEPNVRAREGRLRVQGRRPAFQDGGGRCARAAPVRHLPRADAAVPCREEPPREEGPRASNLKSCAHPCRATDRPCHHSRRWCQEDIKAWRKCFEEQRALDGRPVDSSDSPLQKARQKLDPAKYDKQGRPLK